MTHRVCGVFGAGQLAVKINTVFNVLDFSKENVDAAVLRERLPRAALNVERAVEAVAPLIEAVRREGAKALRDQAEQFDQVRPRLLRVPAAEIERALQELDPGLREAIETSIANNRKGHEAQLPRPVVTEIIPGGTVTQRWIPVRRVGLYVPGGLAVYPSSVIMNVVAAQVAGVDQIALASPAQQAFGGSVHPTVLATCALLGVSEVYAMGGAGAIGAFAYGAKGETAEDGQVLVEPVDVVTGPGNIYVAAAKRVVSSVCGIDAEAGTTEIAIIADSSATPKFVAADLISQAEHDPAAASVLITDSTDLVTQVRAELERQVPQRDHHERIATALSGPQSGAILTRDIEQSIAVANAYGAEHLEVQTADAREVAAKIHNAGAIFVGDYTPVPLGDYLAGSNHVLPTGGTASHASGLNVMAFLKSVQQIEYTQQAADALTDRLVVFSHAEDLEGHGASLLARREGK